VILPVKNLHNGCRTDGAVSKLNQSEGGPIHFGNIVCLTADAEKVVSLVKPYRRKSSCLRNESFLHLPFITA